MISPTRQARHFPHRQTHNNNGCMSVVTLRVGIGGVARGSSWGRQKEVEIMDIQTIVLYTLCFVGGSIIGAAGTENKSLAILGYILLFGAMIGLWAL